MIAYYQKQYFNISLNRNPMRIWRYDFVNGFTKKIKPDGLVVYEKYVAPEEIDEIFDVGFSIKWNGEWYGVSYSEKYDCVTFVTYDEKLAREYNMIEIEHGVFEHSLPVSKCESFRLWKFDIEKRADAYTILSLNEFKELWKLMKQDLFPPR